MSIDRESLYTPEERSEIRRLHEMGRLNEQESADRQRDERNTNWVLLAVMLGTLYVIARML